MHSVNARDARKLLGDLLTEAAHGGVISITRRGREVARLVPPETAEPKGFPALREFRDSISVKGKATSLHVSDLREEERF